MTESLHNDNYLTLDIPACALHDRWVPQCMSIQTCLSRQSRHC